VWFWDKLKAADTGFVSDRFFVGRWRTSRAAAWIAVGTPSGYGGFAADRLWRNTNLLIRFDAAGAVESYEAFPDKLFVEKLMPVALDQKLADTEQLETTFALAGSEIPVNRVLSTEQIEVSEMAHFKSLKHRPQYHYIVPSRQLEKVTVSHYQNNVTYLDVSIHFFADLRTYQGPRGKKTTLQMTVPQLITRLSYASHRAPHDVASPN
jgi:hypothetical protein